MLKFASVKKHYEDFELDLTLEVPEGYVTGLIGANGAGKSTAFKAALGLIRPDAGVVKMLGKNVEDFTVQDKERIGVVLADSGFSGYLRVKDILPMLESMYHKFQKEDFLEMCKKYQLPLDKKIKEFSTGMKRKLQIAAAVSHGADVLFLDECIYTIKAGLLDEALLLDFLDHKPEKLEVILTGQGPSEELMKRADYISEICMRKHPFEKGIPARPGIER